MSIICACYTQDGIVMAADSRFTAESSSKKYTFSDGAQKIALLSNRIGVSWAGEGMIDDKSIVRYMREFERKNVTPSDSVENIANKLSRCYNKNDTVFLVCGYECFEQRVFKVRNGEVTQENIGAESNVIWAGKPEAMDRLFNTEPQIIIDWKHMPLKDAIDLSEFIIDATIKYERFKAGMQTCGGDIDVLVLTIDDAFWYRHKIFKRRFSALSILRGHTR